MNTQTPIDGYITMLVPEADVPEAAKIFRALDPDLGGIESFGPPNKEGLCLASMPASAERILLFKKLEESPEDFKDFVQRDYEARWKLTEEQQVEVDKNAVLKAKLEPIKAESYSKLALSSFYADISVEELKKGGYDATPKVLLEADVKEVVVKG